MKHDNIDSLFQDFNRYAEESRTQLSGMLSVISEGRAPSRQDVDKLDVSISQLRAKYDLIYQAAADQLPDEEMPNDGSSASDYVNAVNRCEHVRVKQQIEKARDVLEKFLSIRSLVDTYMDALTPFQKDAAVFLQTLKNEENVDLETVEEKTAGPEALLSAVECPDKDSEEGIELCDRVAEFYPRRVFSGVVANKYFLEAPANAGEGEKEETDKLLETPGKNDAKENDEELPPKNKKAVSPESVAEHKQPDSSSETGSDTEDSAAVSEESEFVKALRANQCFVESGDEFGSIDIEKSDKERNKISSSIFKNEMKSSGLAQATRKAVAESLCSINIITPNILLATHKGMPKEVAENSLSILAKLGYLCRYHIHPGGEFFCASKRLINALSFQEASEYVGVKKRTVESWGSTIADVPSGIAARVCLAELYASSMNRFALCGIKAHTETLSVLTSAFCACITAKDNDAEFCEVFAGGFWTDSAECDQFLDSWKKTLSECPAPTVFVFAAKNKVYAKNIFEVLRKDLVPLETCCSVYLYSLSDQKYYSYPDLTPTDREKLGNENNGGETAETDLEEAQEIADDPNLSDKAEERPEQDQTESNVGMDDLVEQESIDEPKPVVERSVTSTEESKNADLQDAKEPADGLLDSDEDSVERLVNLSDRAPTDDELYDLINRILDGKAGREFNENSSIAQALLLAKTASFSDCNYKCKELNAQLTLATKSPLDDIPYNNENLSNGFNTTPSNAVKLSAYLFAMLTPSVAYDWGMIAQTKGYLKTFDDSFPELLDVKQLYAKMTEIYDDNTIPSGFSLSVLARIGSVAEKKAYENKLRDRTKRLLEYTPPHIGIRKLRPFYSKCFGKQRNQSDQSDLYKCLELISNDSPDALDWVDLYLSEICEKKSEVLVINSEKVEEIIDKTWDEVREQGDLLQLEEKARQCILRDFYNRLNVIKEWAEHKHALPEDKESFSKVIKLKKEITELAKKALEDISNCQFRHKSVIIYALNRIRDYLDCPLETKTPLFRELAQTGVISMNDDWLPILDENLIRVKYSEPWRSVLRHILSSINNLEQAKEQILDTRSSELFDNLHQLEIIGELTKEPLQSTDTQIKRANDTALVDSKNFDNELELAYTYNRINETEKEDLVEIKRQYEPGFLNRKDFGIWRQFLQALRKQIEVLTEKRKAELQSRLGECITTKTGETSSILKAAQRLIEEKNFAVAEEYIYRFDNGEEDFSEELQSVLQETDYLSEFVSDDCYAAIYNECTKGVKDRINFNYVARDYLDGDSMRKRGHFPKEWTVHLREDSLKFIREKYWPNTKATATQIVNLFKWIGLDVTDAVRNTAKGEEVFKITVQATPCRMADYRHPISAFGTQAKNQMNVVVLQGNIMAKQLVDKISSLGLGELAIVILNFPISLPVRRQIAEEFHKTTGKNSFILIDQVLAVFLALHQSTERLPALLKCTLPFTTYQPFVNGAGRTSDEMFFGRKAELDAIMEPTGACIVYGGRQLGKTALLERAESLCHKPENQEFAVYCTLLEISQEEDVVKKLSDEFQKKTGLVIKEATSLEEFCKEIQVLFESKKLARLLLLLDETDAFLGSIADQKYLTLHSLIELKRSTRNNFKFVLAGTHNVCRAKNATALNGVPGQLGEPLCVKPLSPTDALQLLSRPLQYLGFQIGRYPHLETILTNTNYYPGILQLFGYKLVETLSKNYGKYYRAVNGNPPFTLQDKQLGDVMNSAELNNCIRDRFRYSLELDPRYYMIARCIAFQHYDDPDKRLGCSVEDIKWIADFFNIHCLKSASEKEYEVLLDEMVDMGILGQPKDEHSLYRLRRSSFVELIGKNVKEVQNDIEKNNSEESQ